jgi:ankyrin repeat protein
LIKLAVLTIERYYYSYRLRKAYQERLEIIRRMKSNKLAHIKEAKQKIRNVVSILNMSSKKAKGFGLRHQNTRVEESVPASTGLKRSFSQSGVRSAFMGDSPRVLPLAKTINQRLVLAKAKCNNFKQLEHTTVKLMPNDINCVDILKNTPLFYAASHGNKDFCHYLIQKGAIVNLACQGGDTALHMAFKSGNRGVTFD